jgi:CHAD domain-containing protein
MTPLTALSLACVALSINQMLMARRIHQLEIRIRRIRRALEALPND